jgi:hypothetical protein
VRPMPERLTDSLVRSGALDPAQADEALDRQVLLGGALDTSLLELQLTTEDELLPALEDAYGLPAASAERTLAPADPKALRALPERWAQKHMLAPLVLDEAQDKLTVLTPAPLDAGLLARLGDLLELTLEPILAPEFRVWQRLARLYDVEPPERFVALIAQHSGVEGPLEVPAPASEPPAAAPLEPPLGFSEAVSQLREARDRDEIVRIALRYASRDLALVAVFIHHEDHLEGWMGRGPGSEHLPHLQVPLTPSSAFRVVLDTQAHYLGPLPSDPTHAELLEHLGRPRPRGVLIVPVRIRNRTVAVLYGENGDEAIAPRLAADLMLFTTHLQLALESLLVRKKAESLSELHRRESTEPRPASLVRTPSWADAVAPGLEPPEDTDRQPAPTRAPASGARASAVLAALLEEAAEAAEDEPTDEGAAVVIEEPEELPAPVPEALEVPILEAEAPPESEDPTGPQDALPSQEPLDAEPGHPLLDDDDAWESVSAPEPDALGDALDQSISAAQAALAEEAPPLEPGLLDRGALAAEGGQALLDELDELTSSLEAALAHSEQRSAEPLPPEAEDEDEDEDEEKAPPGRASLATRAGSAEDGWDDVDVDGWDDGPSTFVGLNPAQAVPVAGGWSEVPEDEDEPLSADTLAPTQQVGLPVPDASARAAARASLTEDTTLPDLSAEAWIRASSEVTRARPLPLEVMEAAARPAEPEPVPLTRITIGRQKSTLTALEEVHPERHHDARYDASTPPPSVFDPAYMGGAGGGAIPVLLGQPTPIEVDIEEDLGDEEPVPLTQLSHGGYGAAAPGAFAADPDPFGEDPGLYDSGDPEDEGSLEEALHAGGEPQDTLPIRQLDARQVRAHEEALGWVGELNAPDAGQRVAAAEALAHMGPAALPVLAERFPGAVVLDPFAPDADLPPFAKCGPLLSVLERLGRDAHPFVAAFLEAPNPHHRFFSIYFYSAVYVPEVIPRLIQRLHDEEPRICMLAARTLFAYREHPDFALVLDHLHGRLGATSANARRHACYLIGLFRDVSAIPLLFDILDRKDKGMVDVVEDALAEITKQRLGPTSKKWRAWWAKNQARSRIAWLVDGLAAKEVELRKSAAEELRAVTGLDMGFDENAPKRLRDEARQRWIDWWSKQN